MSPLCLLLSQKQYVLKLHSTPSQLPFRSKVRKEGHIKLHNCQLSSPESLGNPRSLFCAITKVQTDHWFGNFGCIESQILSRDVDGGDEVGPRTYGFQIMGWQRSLSPSHQQFAWLGCKLPCTGLTWSGHGRSACRSHSISESERGSKLGRECG